MRQTCEISKFQDLSGRRTENYFKSKMRYSSVWYKWEPFENLRHSDLSMYSLKNVTLGMAITNGVQ